MQEQKFMTAEKLLAIHADLEKMGVTIYLDGGWGTDALLGEETRPHKDVDFFIEKKNLEEVRQYFFDRGFEPSKEESSTWWHFLLENADTIVDIHVIDFDSRGRGIYGPPENGAVFPADAFTGIGHVNGVEVLCLSADYRVLCLTVAYGVITRTGYTLKETDYQDIEKLCKKFNIEMPPEYIVNRKKLKTKI